MDKDLVNDSLIHKPNTAYLWQALQLFNLYRVILATSFIAITRLHIELNFFGVVNELLFQQTSAIYLMCSLFFLCISLMFKRYYNLQANLPIFFDIIAIIMIMHASGGIISGIGILLIVIMAAHSLLAPGRFSLFSALIAVICLFAEHSYDYFWHKTSINMFTQVGLLGLVIIATSFVTSILSVRTRKTQLIIEAQAQQLATSRAQDLKLASLAHLTANIAHEIRNPLGAASHAAQLVAESHSLSEEDKHFVKMITQSCNRMNKVINNVLSLSGHKPANIQKFILVPWLQQFIKDFIVPTIEKPQITLHWDSPEHCVKIDPGQLTQILINLCENGLRYSFCHTGAATLALNVKKSSNPPAIYLDVVDQGKGVPATALNHIFEPFFTTEKSGSGLGLFIARELSQLNGARLDYFPVSQGGQFRITLPLGDQS